jgi:Prp8 binding protein
MNDYHPEQEEDEEFGGDPQPPPSKRHRHGSNDNDDDNNNDNHRPLPTTTALTVIPNDRGSATTVVASSSSLPSPTLSLTGHTGSVYALAYSPGDGDILCSASFDKTCLLWNHASKNYENFYVLRGHKNAVLNVTFFEHDPTTVVTASADTTLMIWDVERGQRLRKYIEHHPHIVNAVAALDHERIVSVADDGTMKIWDRKQKRSVASFQTKYPLLAVTCNHENHTHMYTSGIDPGIYAFDARKFHTPMFQMKGHTDTVTSLAMHPQNTHVLSNSMDQTLKSWDIRPYCANPQKRNTATFRGHVHSAEKGILQCAWNTSDDANLVTAGSADGIVRIWDVPSQQILYELPGHTGAVNAVVFHPHETNVIASASSDKTILVGELAS